MVRIPSPTAILAASKAARTVPHQQGNGVLAVPGGNATWGGVYATGSMLPRPLQDFTEGAFTPLAPIYPYPVDQPPPGSERPMPRRRQYQVGENLPGSGQRTEFGPVSFGQLRALSYYSVARACIQLLKSEIRGLEWDIVPTKDAAKAMRGDHKAMQDFGERRSKMIRFFKNPDPEYGSWSSWIDTLLEDVYAIDALSCYLRPSRLRGRGLLGSDLAALELIDGTTFRPLVDVHGSRPSPPSVAFQQYIWGVPRTDNMSIMMGADLPPGMSDAKVRDYRGDQLLYLPYTRRTNSPYGSPPVEQALVPVTNGLAKQAYQSQYFDQGSIPQVYISPGDAAMTAAQVKELQEAFNIISGDIGYKFKVVVLPPGSRPYPMKDPVLADQFDQIVMVEVCMAFNVQPTELGIMPQVATVQTPSAMNQATKAQSAIHQRKSLVPMLQWLKQGLLDKVIQVVTGQHDMQFMFEGLEEDEDEATLTGLLIQQVGGGLASVDEARAELGRDPWGLPVTSDPLWASANGVMLLGSVDPVTGQPAGQPAALPSVGQQMSGAAGGSATPMANAGQANPAGALAQGHMPGTTHVPPAQPDRQQTPSHSAAIAGAAEAAARTATSSSKAVHVITDARVPVPEKALLSELDALGRHVRKGRDPSTWQPVHIPGALMASITEDMAKGLDAAEVLTAAVSVVLPKASAPGPYATQVNQAFAQVQQQAEALFAQYLAGTLPVSAKALASMIADLILAALTGVLGPLYVSGFASGYQAGLKAAGLPPATQEQAQALARQEMASWSRQAAIRQMSVTGMAGLAAAIIALLAAGTATAAALMALLAAVLTPGRADLIAVTEWQKAFSDGKDAAQAQAGVGWVRWKTREDSEVCAGCKENARVSPRPRGSVWPGTHTKGCPGHPRCRCELVGAEPPPAAPIGPPVSVAKAAKDWDWKHPDTSLPVADQVYRQLLEDFPPEAIAWVKRAKWTGPKPVPLDAVESQPSRWQAGHEPSKVERFRRKITARVAKGKMGHKPSVLCDRPDTPRGTHLYVVDGHHRVMADHELGRPVDAYVGIVDEKDVLAAQETHSSQKKADDPGASDTAASKSFTAGALGDGSVHGLVPFGLTGPEPPVAAGIVVRAADTGRILMLQRAVTQDDPAGGHWEFPGGCLDPGEDALEAASREWAEECGMPLPDGEPGGRWQSRNGAYHGFVLTVPSEFPVHEGRDQVTNPDDPDHDQVEAIAWWDVSQLQGNPAVRRELLGDLDLLMNALAAPMPERGR